MTQCVLDLILLPRVVPQYPVFELGDPLQDVLEWFAIFLTVKGLDWLSLHGNTFRPGLLTQAMLPINTVGVEGDFLPLSLQTLCPTNTVAKGILSVSRHFPVNLSQPSCDRFGKSYQISKICFTGRYNVFQNVQKLRPHTSNVRVLKYVLTLGDSLFDKRYVVFHNLDLVIDSLAAGNHLITFNRSRVQWQRCTGAGSDFAFYLGQPRDLCGYFSQQEVFLPCQRVERGCLLSF